MKKGVYFRSLVIFVLVPLLMTACSPKPTTESKSNPATVSEEVLIPMRDIPDDYFHATLKNLTRLDEQVEELTFWEYIDDDGIKYYFDKEDGSQLGFSNIGTGMSLPTVDIPMTEWESVADSVAERYVDLESYKRSYFWQEDTRTHKFSYVKHIQGYPTTDYGSVWLRDSGYLVRVLFRNVGVYDDVEESLNIDEKILDKRFYEALQEKKVTCTEITQRTLDMQDRKLYMSYEYEFVAEEIDGIEYFELDKQLVRIS